MTFVTTVLEKLVPSQRFHFFVVNIRGCECFPKRSQRSLYVIPLFNHSLKLSHFFVYYLIFIFILRLAWICRMMRKKKHRCCLKYWVISLKWLQHAWAENIHDDEMRLNLILCDTNGGWADPWWVNLLF